MKYDELYADLCGSVQKWCNDRLPSGFQFVDFDAHAEISELPDGNLLGPAGIGMVDDAGTYEVMLSVGVSTQNDPNLFLLRKIISAVHAGLRAEQKILIYRMSSGVPTPIGWLAMQSPTMITPTVREGSRSLQFVNAKGLLDPLLPHA